MATCDLEGAGGEQRVEKGQRDRSKSFSAGQRPTPKPRRPAPRRTHSILQNGCGQLVSGSASADSSPQMTARTKTKSILQPTPLVMSLQNQLVSQFTSSCADNQHQKARNEQTNEAQKTNNDSDLEVQVSKKEMLKLDTKHSPIIRRERSHSEPRRKIVPPRPPPPSHPPPPNPRLSRLILENRSSYTPHVIDSRSKTPPARRPDSKKMTIYGTPPPSRPAPPPPQVKASPQKLQQTAPVSKPRNSPVIVSRTPPIPKPRNLDSVTQLTPSPGSRAHQQGGIASKTISKESVDKSYPVYEDLDNDSYEILDHSSHSEDEEVFKDRGDGDETSTNGGAPPKLPSKKGLRQSKEEEELPPLPPRTKKPTNTKRHHLHGLRGDDEKIEANELVENKEEALQHTGSYEPLDYSDSDQHSEDSYTEMNNPFGQTSDDNNLEDDQPEPIYIMMDPDEYIPPPDSYRSTPEKKKSVDENK